MHKFNTLLIVLLITQACSTPPENNIASIDLYSINEQETELLRNRLLKIETNYLNKYKSINNPFHFIENIGSDLPDNEKETLQAFFIFDAITNPNVWPKHTSIKTGYFYREGIKYFKEQFKESNHFKLLEIVVASTYFLEKTQPLESISLLDKMQIPTDLTFGDKSYILYFWATWCMPCLELEIPWENAVKKYENRTDLQFIKISVDKDFDQWSSYKTYGSKNSESKLISQEEKERLDKIIGLSALPRFVFINPDGDIDIINGPRPNTGIFDELIDMYPKVEHKP